MGKEQQFVFRDSGRPPRVEVVPMWLRINPGGLDSGGDDMPILGEVRMFAGVVPPLWVNLADGPISRTTFSELFAYLGTLWGPGDGLTTFDLPPSQRVPIGAGGQIGLSARVLGQTGGGETFQLTAATSGIPDGVALTVTDPTHLHSSGSIGDSGHSHSVATGTVNVTDPGHTHSSPADSFVTNQAGGTQYVSAAADEGASTPNTASNTTGITASLSGNTDAGNATIVGSTAAQATGIAVATVGTDAAFPFEIMNPYAVFNFAIFANA